jgi:cadherin-like protein
MRLRLLATSLVVGLVVATAPAAHAFLERVGPVDIANGGYPAWYQDTTGLTMEFCEPTVQAELNGGWCLILPANLPTGAVPEVPFTNYSVEHFYWNATAGKRNAGLLVLSMEGSFANGSVPLAGDQITFGRLRITYPSVPTTGDYKVYTPFGVFNFPGMQAGQKIFFTQDAGLTCGTDFTCALNTVLGPFLLPSPYPGGPEVPPIPDLLPGQDPYNDAIAVKTAYPGTGKKYIADPARIGPLTGGTCVVNAAPPGTVGACIMGVPPTDPPGTVARPVYVTSEGLRDPNIFRIEVNGGAPALVEHQLDWTTAGRVMTGAIPSKVTLDRATYKADATTNRVDVFATASAAVTGRLPAGQLTPPTVADLGVFPAPCTTDPLTGLVTGGPLAPAGTTLTYFPLFSDGAAPTAKWWAQMLNLTDPVSGLPAVPGQVCVQDLAAVNAAGQRVPAYYMGTVTDDVHINWASVMWDPTAGGGTLTVSAASSDTTATPPVLTLSGYTVADPVSGLPVPAVIDATGSVAVSGVGAPPSKVTVTSSKGGIASLNTTTGIGTPVSATVPVAGATTLAIAEDCQALVAPALAQSHTACPAPGQPLPTSATLNGATPASYTVSITTLPRLGKVSCGVPAVAITTAPSAACDPATLTYAPNLDATGTDIVGYKVTVGTSQSPEAYATVTITPVNDFPIAVNDPVGAAANKPITINVLANDSDPDGAADLKAAVIQTLPAGATLTCNGGVAAVVGTVCTGGLVTFTAPNSATPYTFTYQAQDTAGALSAAATVTVTIAQAEAIIITKSIYTVSKGRWTVSGTDNILGAQTLTVTFNNGTYASGASAVGTVIGTATVDPTGAWLYDNNGGAAGTKLDPSASGVWSVKPTQINVSSPFGGASTATINLK